MLNTPPHRHEWEFGNVPPDQRDWCALWEYARESNWITEEVDKWFSTRFAFPVPFTIERPRKPAKNTKAPFGPPGRAGKTVEEILQMPGCNTKDAVSCLDALPNTLKWGTRKPPKTLPDRYPDFLRRFCQLVIELPIFPTAWLAIKATKRQRAVERLAKAGYRVFSDISTAAIRIEEFDIGIERIQLARTIMEGMWPDWQTPEKPHHYILTVDWDECTRDKAIKQFKAWLKANPHRKKRTGGRSIQTPVSSELLRNLAAQRWSIECFTLAEAHKAIMSLGINDPHLLPNLAYPKEGKATEVTSDVWWHRCETAKKTVLTIFPRPKR